RTAYVDRRRGVGTRRGGACGRSRRTDGWDDSRPSGAEERGFAGDHRTLSLVPSSYLHRHAAGGDWVISVPADVAGRNRECCRDRLPGGQGALRRAVAAGALSGICRVHAAQLGTAAGHGTRARVKSAPSFYLLHPSAATVAI